MQYSMIKDVMQYTNLPKYHLHLLCFKWHKETVTKSKQMG